MRFSSIFAFKTAVILLKYLFDIVFNRARYTEWAGESSQGKALNQISSPPSLFVPMSRSGNQMARIKETPEFDFGRKLFFFLSSFLVFFFLFVSLSLVIIDFLFLYRAQVS